MKSALSVKFLTVLVVAFLYWGLIFLLTHIPNPPKAHIPGLDKLQHAGAYGVLGLLLSALVWRLTLSMRKTFFIVMGMVAAYGAVDELTQMLVPNRSADIKDWIADIVGGLLGIAAFRIIGPWLGLRIVRPAHPSPAQE